MSQVVLLIHGVGNAGAGELADAVRNHSSRLGFSPTQLYEFHWNALVKDSGPSAASSWRRATWSVTSASVAIPSVIRGLLGSALVDEVPPVAASVRTALFGLLGTAPLLAAWALMYTVTAANSRLSDSWQLFVTPLYLVSLPLLGLCSALVAHSNRALMITAELWAASAVAFAAIYIVIGWLGGRRSTFPSLRTVVLGIAWIAVGVCSYVIVLLVAGMPVYAGLSILFMVIGNAGSESREIIAPHIPTAIEHVPQMLLSAGTAVVAIGILSYFTMLVLGPIIKVIADIFRYIGDPRYRDTLQTGLSERVASIGEIAGGHVYVVGHSLGSVIAVHGLLRADSAFRQTAQITLITMGSPLHRFFFRFFECVASAPDALSRALSQRYRGFRWVNVYRPLDPIGTRLFRAPSSQMCDLTTRQWTRVFLSAHTNYWSDPEVARVLGHALDQPEQKSAASSSSTPCHLLEGAGERHLPKTVRSTLVAFVVWAPIVLGFVDHLFAEPYFERRDYLETMKRVDQDPVEAIATVETIRVAKPDGNGLAHESTKDVITYGPGLAPHLCSGSHGACKQTIDWKMANYIKAQPSGQANIRYRRSDPRRFYALGYIPGPPDALAVAGAIFGWLMLSALWLWGAHKYGGLVVDAWLGQAA